MCHERMRQNASLTPLTYPEDVEWAAATFTSLLFLVPHTVSQDDVLYFINMFSRG